MAGRFAADFRTAALALLLFLAPGGWAAAQQVVIADILVEGNQRIEANTVRFYLDLEPGDEVTPGEINAALRALQESGLFRDVAIEMQGSSLVVRVTERPFVNSVVFEGNDIIDGESLAAGIRTRARTVYSAATVEADASRIVEFYARSGRLNATVVPKYIERENNRVDVVFEIDEGPTSRVRRIAFVGNRVFSDWTLRRVIASREAAWYRIFVATDLFDAGRLEADKAALGRYYAARGYADFEVLSAVASLTGSGSGFVITFTISEGERYDFGEVSLVSQVPGVEPDSLLDLIDMEPGDVYDASLVVQTAEAMQGQIERSGLPFVEVEVDTEANAEELLVDVGYRILPGQRVYVERIQIDGNVRTLDRVLRREFTFAEGDPFNRTKLASTRRNLRALGFFSTVDLRVVEGSRPDRVVVEVEVEEQSTGSLSFGVGYSSVDKVVGSITLTERNLLGRGQEVVFNYETSDGGDLYRFAFTEPRFLERDLAAGIDVYRIVDKVNSYQRYRLTRTGVSPTVEFPISEETRVGLNYQLESNETTLGTGRSPLIRAMAGKTLSSSAGYRVEWDRRDDPLQPSTGALVTFSQQLAGLGGDTKTLASEVSGTYFRPFDRDATLIGSLNFWGGAISKYGGYELEGADRFLIGGSRLRGFAYGGVGPRDPRTRESLGSKFYTVGSAELLSDVFLPEELGIRAGVFLDVGTAWSLDRTRYDVSMKGTAKALDAAVAGAPRRGGRITCAAGVAEEVEEGEEDTGVESRACQVSVDDKARLRSSTGLQFRWASPVGPMQFVFAREIESEPYDVDESFRFIIGSTF